MERIQCSRCGAKVTMYYNVLFVGGVCLKCFNILHKRVERNIGKVN